jgi:hypothetical protein
VETNKENDSGELGGGRASNFSEKLIEAGFFKLWAFGGRGASTSTPPTQRYDGDFIL